MINIIGKAKNQEIQEIIDFFNSKTDKKEYFKDVKIYVGFPIYKSSLNGQKIQIDLIAITNKGLIIFNFLKDNIARYDEIQDDLYRHIELNLKKYSMLIKKRDFIFKIGIITSARNELIEVIEGYSLVKSIDELPHTLDDLFKETEDISDEIFKKIDSALQDSFDSTEKPNRISSFQGSKANRINELKNLIENYDNSQMEAILADPLGIQRIRGMAGSGKTIILARKVAQIHLEHPEWKLAITYATRSQKQQMISFITKFYYRMSENKEPSWGNIDIIHAWGSSSANGIYYSTCINNSLQYLTFANAKFYDKKDPFNYACKTLLQEAETNNIELVKKYDCIFIDEAQDFGNYFFKLCLKILTNERLVYAYDELQNLGGESMSSPKAIFGKGIAVDTPLKVCYRNQKAVIVTAHSIGMGIYSKSGILQLPSAINVWDSIGYESKDKIQLGKNVELYRDKVHSPNLLGIEDDDAIAFIDSNSNENQLKLLVDLIQKDLKEEGLVEKDIMIIDLDENNAFNNYNKFYTTYKDDFKFNIHYAGSKSPEIFWEESSIAYSSIYRAKGNETFMVYIINAHKTLNAITPLAARNALFTAITRSKGWVRVIGYGEYMKDLIGEFEKVRENNFKIKFTPYPTQADQKKIRLYNKDLDEKDARQISKVTEMIEKLIKDERDPLLIAQQLFKVSTKEELIEKLKLGLLDEDE